MIEKWDYEDATNEELHMIKAWQCSLCPMQLPNDDSIKHRKGRHDEKHTRGWSYKAQRNGGGNNTMGIPVYTEVYED